MTEAEKAAALADEIDDELNELRGRFANRENDHFSFGLKFSSWDTIARALRRLAETEARPAGNLREVVAKAIGIAVMEPADPTPQKVNPMRIALRWADAALSVIATTGYVILPREPTDEMVERTARALCSADSWSPDGKDFFGDIANWRNYETPARLSLRAALTLTTKEPTP